MKRIILALIAVLLVLSVGCAQSNMPPADNPPGTDGVSSPDGGSTPPGDSTNIVLPADAPPENVTWISPGKVNVSNFYPGARAEYPITIHNGNDFACTFNVTYRYPDHVGEGYSKPPAEAQDWVMVVDTTPMLAPQETREVLIVLEIPEGMVVIEQEWEFWVSVMDMSQTGTVRTELCCRWLISMRS